MLCPFLGPLNFYTFLPQRLYDVLLCMIYVKYSLLSCVLFLERVLVRSGGPVIPCSNLSAVTKFIHLLYFVTDG